MLGYGEKIDLRWDVGWGIIRAAVYQKDRVVGAVSARVNVVGYFLPLAVPLQCNAHFKLIACRRAGKEGGPCRLDAL